MGFALLDLYVYELCFVIIVCPFVFFSFGYYVVCPSICGFSPPYRFGIFKLFLCIKQSLHRN
jgi:hypothetical protein